MRQRPFRVALDGLRQALDGAPDRFWPVGVTLAETGHELVIRFRVAAVPITGFRHGRRKPFSQRFHDLTSNFVLHVEDVFQVKVVLLGRNALLRHRVE